MKYFKKFQNYTIIVILLSSLSCNEFQNYFDCISMYSTPKEITISSGESFSFFITLKNEYTETISTIIKISLPSGLYIEKIKSDTVINSFDKSNYSLMCILKEDRKVNICVVGKTSCTLKKGQTLTINIEMISSESNIYKNISIPIQIK